MGQKNLMKFYATCGVVIHPAVYGIAAYNLIAK